MKIVNFVHELPKTLAFLLFILSIYYRIGVVLRNRLYDWGFFKSHRVPARVISVGNIVCGGSGKTPLVALLAKKMAAKKHVAILTRGYKSSYEHNAKATPITAENLPSVSLCGDEPYLLAKKLPGIIIWVGHDRVQGAKQAIASGADLLLLDDGMQHRRLARDFDLVVLDGKDLLGDDHFLPFGRLRDTPSRLERVDAIFVNHVQDEKHFEEIKKELNRYSTAPVFGMGYRVETQPTQKVGLFCALGTPMRFLETATKAGFEVVAKQFALDHRPFDLKQLNSFAAYAKDRGATILVCTEKDAVKLPDVYMLPLPIEVLKGELKIRFGKEEFEIFVERMMR